MITHIVLFKLKDPSPENLKKTCEVLWGMKGKIPFMRSIEVGVDMVHSPRSYDLALVARFDSLEDLQAYQAHPVHLEVLNYMATVREAAVAVDYGS